MRDGLFLSFFAVQSLPYFMAGAAVLAIAAAQVSGRLLARLGPARVVPVLFASSAALFLVEWLLLGPRPRAAAALLYVHTSVLGAIAISAFWSLLNERFDPHSAKPLMARVAAAATFGGFVGGIGVERVVALLPAGALLPLLALVGGCCVAGAVVAAQGSASPAREHAGDEPGDTGHRGANPAPAAAAGPGSRRRSGGGGRGAGRISAQGRGGRLLRKRSSSSCASSGCSMRAPASARSLIQYTVWAARSGAPRLVDRSRPTRRSSARRGPTRVRAAVSVARHLPPRLDLVVRNSIFRAGYELLYTPLAETTKRSAKSIIDVACDCAGKGLGPR